MFSNTANNSASDKVKTLPKWKAYLNFITSFARNHQQAIALIAGYLLAAILFFNLGRFWTQTRPPEIRIEEPTLDLSQIYNNLKTAGGEVAGEITELNCEGKIKGNISSSGKIYHLPGGAFYARTNPEMCFDTESQAQSAGFRKSSR